MFEIEPGLIFWNTVSFAILVLIMYRWVLPPILALLKSREKTIADALSSAAAGQKKAEELMAEHKQQLAQARRQGEEITELARQEGERQKKEIVAKAQQQAKLTLEQTRLEMINEKEKVLKSVRQETAAMVALAATKLLKKKVTLEDNQRLIEDALQEIANERH